MRRLVVSICTFMGLLGCAGREQDGAPAEGKADYWQTPAYKNSPHTGPKNAKGIIFWSHGVSGQRVAWKSPPARFIHDFDRAGWDVMKINRHNLGEHGWSTSGPKHVAHLVKQARKAKADGYRRIIAAGQSYGGAISLEAAAENNLFFGIIAAAPGHGSDACGRFASPFRRADELTDLLVEAISRAKSSRILLTMAKDDECMEFNEPTNALRSALAKLSTSFIFLDDKMPIRGHFAALRSQFKAWYGACVLAFFDPDTKPAPGENHCKPPAPLPQYLLPDGFQVPMNTEDKSNLVGTWHGTYEVESSIYSDTRNLCLFVETDFGGSIITKLAFGSGRKLKLNMATRNRTFVKNASGYSFHGSKKYAISLVPNSDKTELAMTITSKSGKRTWSAVMKRGCDLYH